MPQEDAVSKGRACRSGALALSYLGREEPSACPLRAKAAAQRLGHWAQAQGSRLLFGQAHGCASVAFSYRHLMGEYCVRYGCTSNTEAWSLCDVSINPLPFRRCLYLPIWQHLDHSIYKVSSCLPQQAAWSSWSTRNILPQCIILSGVATLKAI